MDFLYKKISSNTFHIINDKTYQLPISSLPFGLKTDNDKYTLTFSINENHIYGKQFLDKINEIDKYFLGLDFVMNDLGEKVLLSNKKFSPSIKQNNPYPPLFKTYIKKSKNTVITKIYGKTKLATIFDIQPKDKSKGVVELGSLWFNNNSYGLLWFMTEIEMI